MMDIERYGFRHSFRVLLKGYLFEEISLMKEDR